MSYGAAIALDYAFDHPENVRTLALIEPPAFWVLGGQKPSGKEYESLVDLERTIHEDVSEEQLEQFACAVGLCQPGKSPREMPSGNSGCSTGNPFSIPARRFVTGIILRGCIPLRLRYYCEGKWFSEVPASDKSMNWPCSFLMRRSKKCLQVMLRISFLWIVSEDMAMFQTNYSRHSATA